MNPQTPKKKLLLVGAGNLCLQILKILGPKNAFEFVVLGRNEESTLRLCNLVALSCAQLGHDIAIKPVIADLTDVNKVTRILREEAPDMLVNCASLQSWRVITGLPKRVFEQLDQAQFGPLAAHAPHVDAVRDAGSESLRHRDHDNQRGIPGCGQSDSGQARPGAGYRRGQRG